MLVTSDFQTFSGCCLPLLCTTMISPAHTRSWGGRSGESERERVYFLLEFTANSKPRHIFVYLVISMSPMEEAPSILKTMALITFVTQGML